MPTTPTVCPLHMILPSKVASLSVKYLLPLFDNIPLIKDYVDFLPNLRPCHPGLGQ